MINVLTIAEEMAALQLQHTRCAPADRQAIEARMVELDAALEAGFVSERPWSVQEMEVRPHALPGAVRWVTMEGLVLEVQFMSSTHLMNAILYQARHAKAIAASLAAEADKRDLRGSGNKPWRELEMQARAQAAETLLGEERARRLRRAEEDRTRAEMNALRDNRGPASAVLGGNFGRDPWTFGGGGDGSS